MIRPSNLLMGAAAILLVAAPAAAVTVDGTLDPEYGPAIVVQTLQTGLGSGQITGDNSDGDFNFANGSELDGAYGFIADGVLHLFLPGNLAMRLNQMQTQTITHRLDIFIDSVPNGQETLMVGSGNPINGFTFDAGFEADYWFEMEGDGDPGGGGGGGQNPFWYVRYAALPPGGSGALSLLGTATAGSGTLSGGTNPHGVQATMDNRNIAGVTFGCLASNGAGVTTGTEWRIPLAAIGNPDDCIRVSVLIRNSNSSISNQTLGALPAGTCPPGTASGVSFAAFAGDQFFSICPATTGVAPVAVAGPMLRLLGASPLRGDRVQVAFTLPSDAPATIQLVDGAGRRIAGGAVSAGSGRSGVYDIPLDRHLAQGVYWVRLSQGGLMATRRFAVVR